MADETNQDSKETTKVAKDTTKKMPARKSGGRLDPAVKKKLVEAVKKHRAGERTMASVIKEFEVSPPTAYKIRDRLVAESSGASKPAKPGSAKSTSSEPVMQSKGDENPAVRLIDERIAALKAEIDELQKSRSKLA